jgi:hypothetical protein
MSSTLRAVPHEFVLHGRADAHRRVPRRGGSYACAVQELDQRVV